MTPWPSPVRHAALEAKREPGTWVPALGGTGACTLPSGAFSTAPGGMTAHSQGECDSDANLNCEGHWLEAPDRGRPCSPSAANCRPRPRPHATHAPAGVATSRRGERTGFLPLAGPRESS